MRKTERRTYIPFTLLETEPGAYHIICKASINGVSANFIIDTGASRSLVNNQEKGLSLLLPGEPFKTHGVEGEELKGNMIQLDCLTIGELYIEDMPIASIDLSKINHILHSIAGIEIVGLIGGDLLEKYQAIIDYENKHISLLK